MVSVMSNGDAFAPGEALRNIDILYVDDEPHRRDTMRRMLQALGARRVQLADSGAVGLTVFAGAPVGLVLVEHRMAPMDGITFIRRIRDVALYPKALVPALLIGEKVGPDLVRAAFEAGANHVLSKPMSAAALYERLDWAIRDSRPFAVHNGHYVIKRTPVAASASRGPSAAA